MRSRLTVLYVALAAPPSMFQSQRCDAVPPNFARTLRYVDLSESFNRNAAMRSRLTSDHCGSFRGNICFNRNAAMRSRLTCNRHFDRFSNGYRFQSQRCDAVPPNHHAINHLAAQAQERLPGHGAKRFPALDLPPAPKTSLRFAKRPRRACFSPPRATRPTPNSHGINGLPPQKLFANPNPIFPSPSLCENPSFPRS